MTRQDSAKPEGDRGKRATIDRKSGEVSGSGAGIANPGAPEDYDDDLTAGSGSARKDGDPSNAA